MGFEKSHSIPMDITSYQLILMVRWKKLRNYSFLKKGGIPMEDYDKIVRPSHISRPLRRRRAQMAPDRGPGLCLHARHGSGCTSGYVDRDDSGLSPYDCK